MIPSKVEKLQKCYWRNGQISMRLPTLKEIKQNVKESIENLRPDHLRSLNPTPYKVGFFLRSSSRMNFKVSVTDKLYKFLHQIWLKNAPVGQLD